LRASGNLDIDWLDEFIRSRGLLSGEATVELLLDTAEQELLRADIRAPSARVSRFPLQQLSGLRQGLVVIQRLDLPTAGEVELGQLPDLKPSFGQSGKKGIVLLVICVIRLSRVEQLCLAFVRQDEAGFGQVAGRWCQRFTSSSWVNGTLKFTQVKPTTLVFCPCGWLRE
jgi:hypothetical protein